MFAILVLAATAAGCSTGRAAGGGLEGGQSVVISAAKRVMAPNVSGTLLDGRSFQLSSSRNDVVVLNFWGSWCPPCRAEAPELMAVYTATKNAGVRFLGVNIKDERQLASAFDRNKGVTYPSIFDPDGRVALQFPNYPPNAIPSTIVLDRRRRIAAVFLRPVLKSDLLPVVQRLTQEKS